MMRKLEESRQLYPLLDCGSFFSPYGALCTLTRDIYLNVLTANDELPNEELYPAKILLDASAELEFSFLELSFHQNYATICNNYRFITLINSLNHLL